MLPAASSSIRSILIVDDSSMQRAYAGELCRHLGIATVFEAEDGASALRRLRDEALNPDVLLLDLEMPQMDGLGLVQELHAADIWLPTIIASSRDPNLIESVARVITALGHPLLGWLHKPIGEAALAALLALYESDET